MKILLLIYTYYPSNSPRSLRWTSIAEDLSKRGYEVHVLTKSFKNQPIKELINNVLVYRNSLSVLRFFEFLKKIKSRRNKLYDYSDVKPMRNPIGSFVHGIIHSIYSMTIKKIIWPDADFIWILPIFFKARKLIKLNNYSVFISVSHPFSAHVSGMLIHKCFPTIKWLADCGDPFAFSVETPSNNFKLWGKLNYLMEQKLINEVDFFCCTTPQTEVMYHKHFLSSKKKLIVIPPLINDVTFDFLSQNIENDKNGEIKLLFSGRFYKTLRPPELLLDLLEEIIRESEFLKTRLKLYIVGSPNIIQDELNKRSSLAESVILCGEKSHSDTLRAIRSSDILINLGNSMTYQLPSKIVEYLASGKPIINVCNNMGDSSADVLSQYPFHINWNLADPDRSVREICTFIENNRNKKLPSNRRDLILNDFRTKSVVDKYTSLF